MKDGLADLMESVSIIENNATGMITFLVEEVEATLGKAVRLARAAQDSRLKVLEGLMETVVRVRS